MPFSYPSIFMWHLAWTIVVGIVFCYPFAQAIGDGIECAGRDENRMAPKSPWWFFKFRYGHAVNSMKPIWVLCFIIAFFLARWQGKWWLADNYRSYGQSYLASDLLHTPQFIFAWTTYALVPVAIALWQAAACFVLAPYYYRKTMLAVASVALAGFAWVMTMLAGAFMAHDLWAFIWPQSSEIIIQASSKSVYLVSFGELHPNAYLRARNAQMGAVCGDAIAPIQLIASAIACLVARLHCESRGDSWFPFERERASLIALKSQE